MGNKLSSARIIAPAAFAINFGAQIYGMLASPNMKEVADQNHYAFSPHPIAIGLFFAPQMILQLAWLRQLFYTDAPDESAQLDYVPIYVLGNLCIAGWSPAWTTSHFALSQALVTLNSFAQLYAVARLPPYAPRNALTHLVAKTTAGIGVLDFVDNGAVLLKYRSPPSTLVQALTVGFFGVASLLADQILGGCIVFDLFALASGQQGAWRNVLAWSGVGSAAIVLVRNLFFV